MEVRRSDLEDILMDLGAMGDLLTVMAASDYYNGTKEDNVCRALRNSLDYTKGKLEKIMVDSKSDIDD